MSLRNLCRRETVCVNPGTSVKKAAQLMEEKNIGSLIIVEEGSVKPIGLVTDRDILLRVVNKGLTPDKVPVGIGGTKSTPLVSCIRRSRSRGRSNFTCIAMNVRLSSLKICTNSAGT